MEDLSTAATDSGSALDSGAAADVSGSAPDVAVDDSQQQTSESSEGAEAGESKEWTNLSQKLGLSEWNRDARAKLAKEHWGAKNELSRLTRESADLRQRLQDYEARSQPPAPEVPEPPHPDIQRIDQRLEAFKAYKGGFAQERDRVTAAYHELVGRIARAESEHARADEFDKPRWEAHIAGLKYQQQAAVERFRDMTYRDQQADYEMEKLTRERDYAESFLDAERARQAQAAEQTAQFRRDFPQRVDTFIGGVADEIGVPKDKDSREHLLDVVNAQLANVLWRMGGKPVNETEIAGIAKDLVQRYSKAFGLAGREKLSQVTKDKLAVTARTPQRPAAAKEAKTLMPYEQPPDELMKRVEDARAAFVGRRR